MCHIGRSCNTGVTKQGLLIKGQTIPINHLEKTPNETKHIWRLRQIYSGWLKKLVSEFLRKRPMKISLLGEYSHWHEIESTVFRWISAQTKKEFLNLHPGKKKPVPLLLLQHVADAFSQWHEVTEWSRFYKTFLLYAYPSRGNKNCQKLTKT